MNSQVYKDDVQPAEKTSTDVEETKDSFQNPPPHKQSGSYKIWYTLGFVCFVVGLLSLVCGRMYPTDTGTYEGNLITLFTLNLILPMFAVASGVILLIIGAVVQSFRKSK